VQVVIAPGDFPIAQAVRAFGLSESRIRVRQLMRASDKQSGRILCFGLGHFKWHNLLQADRLRKNRD